MNTPIVEVHNLYVQFGKFYAVKDVSFSVNKGEIFGFLGANGAGKTTTIRVICGLIQATQGEVIVDGEHFVAGKEDIIKSKVGYMSQRFTLYDDLTVKENLDFTASLRQIPDDTYEERKQDLFDMIQFDRTEKTLVKDLPGGTKQQVALVASLLHDPKLVVLDEPTAGVSPAARMRFWDLIRQLTAREKTVFVTTHYMDEAENCDRVVLMRSGELIALGKPNDLKKDTFSKQLYRLTPKFKIEKEHFAPLAAVCEMFEPYGQHFHIILKDEKVLPKFNEYFVVEAIEPSLEDVFIQRVEGDR